MRESTIHREASSSFCSAQTSRQGPLYPTLRANPFPKVTDLFCRLPLPTLLYRPEATNLGDLMRLWVRPGAKTSAPSAFHGPSRALQTPHKSQCSPAAGPLSPANQIPGTPTASNRKDNSAQSSRRRSRVRLRCRLQKIIPPPGSGLLTRFPFAQHFHVQKVFRTEFPQRLGSTHPCPINVRMEPFSTSVFKVLT